MRPCSLYSLYLLLGLALRSSTLPLDSDSAPSIVPSYRPSPPRFTPATTSPIDLTQSATSPVRLPSQPGGFDGSVESNYTCGPIERYYNASPAAWDRANTGVWLDRWWAENQANFPQNGGFSSALGRAFLGNPNWSCRDSDGPNCNINPCNEAKLNRAGVDMEPAYYVLQSVMNLHEYFTGIAAALQISAIGAALAKDKWAYTFHKEKVVPLNAMKEILNVLTTTVGIAAAFAAPFSNAVKIAAASSNTMFSGGITAAKYSIQSRENTTAFEAAKMGGLLSDLFVSSILNLASANDGLMNGSDWQNTGDIRTYIAGGDFVNFAGVDKEAAVKKARQLLVSSAINFLWRQQKVFIMGGGPCDNSGGVGSGPDQAKICSEGRAWYLFYWMEYGGFHLSKKRWGNVDEPPGFSELGKGDYEGIKGEDIIKSSLDAYKVARYEYTADMYQRRTEDALNNGTLAPSEVGPSWEGTFTIPVCDISPVVQDTDTDFPKRDVILQPWGANMVPQWCRPVCAGPDGKVSKDATVEFLKAAQMDNFISFQMYCPLGMWVFGEPRDQSRLR
ncbi:MAG: hypothetical protein M1825_003526 [Sarcosagium campestre]|nr:MAG: hypothetical protein M1825_003526 [Sarcosagium campestre]